MSASPKDHDDVVDPIAELRAELVSLREEVSRLQAAAEGVGAAKDGDPVAEVVAITEAPTNRRGFFKMAGAAAAGAVVASTVAGAQPAAAATNGTMLIGVGNAPTGVDDTTTITVPGTTELSDTLLRANNFSNGSAIVLPTNHAIAVAGTTSGQSTLNRFMTGVYGRTISGATNEADAGQGVFGSTGGAENPFTASRVGVCGSSDGGGFGGVFFNDEATTSTGVIGRANLGTGVIAASTNGLSLYVRGGGRIQQDLRGTAGPPASGAFSVGEQIRDSLGDLYICTAGGSPGTWRKVTAQHPNFAGNGGSVNLLNTPIRIVDTRGGAPITNGTAKLQPNTNLTVQVTGTNVGGVFVPTGATGAIGNITVVNGAGGGFVKLFPQGGVEPGTSAVNFAGGSAAVANSFIVRLNNTNGQITARGGVAAVDVIIDLVGFTF